MGTDRIPKNTHSLILKVGDIIGQYDHYNIIKSPNNIKFFKPIKLLIKEFIFLFLFFLTGPLLTIFFHKRSFNYFFKKIKNDTFSPNTYRTLNNNLLSRIILFLISIFLVIIIPYTLFKKIKEHWEEFDEYDYTWMEIYESLKDNDYCPEKYENGYIHVERFNNTYECVDGNHRLKILTHLYGSQKEIKVKDIGGDPKIGLPTVTFSKVHPIWKDETVFIIGGGASLKNFDFNLLKDKKTIAINKAILYHPTSDIMFWSDKDIYKWFKPYIDKFKGKKYTIYPFSNDWVNKEIKILKSSGKDGLELDPGVVTGGNSSGYAAINLAYHLGVSRIVLLGFDMGHIKGESHFHEGYLGLEVKKEKYVKWGESFTSLAHSLEERGIEVINASPNSALKVFKKLTLEKALQFN